jgi:hypothetical protein
LVVEWSDDEDAAMLDAELHVDAGGERLRLLEQQEQLLVVPEDDELQRLELQLAVVLLLLLL